ncbi:hypothetical protein PtA15_8A545 [Puccinia triticina]|uniref:Uncharacterized protein n=1 Tax=Puccinia triticina TaxID=208348 RepID=A0ABY7CSK0_9BASI|nr:uncharacterized protein PtA15_8A545 [Puccinia triticina]WAQ87639.1 hypothetical protein PtA15_8A545 [Puccinia triticina]
MEVRVNSSGRMDAKSKLRMQARVGKRSKKVATAKKKSSLDESEHERMMEQSRRDWIKLQEASAKWTTTSRPLNGFIKINSEQSSFLSSQQTTASRPPSPTLPGSSFQKKSGTVVKGLKVCMSESTTFSSHHEDATRQQEGNGGGSKSEPSKTPMQQPPPPTLTGGDVACTQMNLGRNRLKVCMTESSTFSSSHDKDGPAAMVGEERNCSSSTSKPEDSSHSLINQQPPTLATADLLPSGMNLGGRNRLKVCMTESSCFSSQHEDNPPMRLGAPEKSMQRPPPSHSKDTPDARGSGEFSVVDEPLTLTGTHGMSSQKKKNGMTMMGLKICMSESSNFSSHNEESALARGHSEQVEGEKQAVDSR